MATRKRTANSLRRFIRKRLQNLGVSLADAGQLSGNFSYQYAHQGEVRAAAYIKGCGDTLLNYLYGTPDKAPWVRTVDRFPVFFDAIRGYSEEVQLRVAKFARAIRFGCVDAKYQKQVDKVVLPVITPFGGDIESLHTLSSLIKAGVELSGIGRLPLKGWNDFQPPLVTKQFKKVQSLGHQTRNVSEPPIRESLQILADHPDLCVEGFERVFWPITATGVRTWVDRLSRPFEDRTPYVGEIHASQEGGGKLRMFASPYTVIQCILYPIHYLISEYRKEISVKAVGGGTDCTHDQTAGALWAQDQLRIGRRVHSVDLSTATCRFPLYPQIELLRYLRVEESMIAALEYVCRGLWRCSADTSVAFATPSLQWEVGQPLGIAPSMSMFSLSHNMLLWGLCDKLRLNPLDSFRVLGDDVVISNDELSDEYIKILLAADIPVSTTKSHHSSKFAEFAGYSITAEHLVRPGQWRPATPVNLLALAEDLKTPLYGEVTKLYEDVQKAYLFGKGLYDPMPEDWPMFIKISTVLQVSGLEQMTVLKAPLWYYHIMTVVDRQLAPNTAFEWSDPSFHREVFKYLDQVLESIRLQHPEHFDDYKIIVDSWYRPGVFFGGGYHQMSMWDAATALSQLWYAGALTQEQYVTAADGLQEVVRSLLYLPPRGAKENKLIHLAKRLSQMLEVVKSPPVDEVYKLQKPQGMHALGTKFPFA
jgi:hypothetical protein